MIAACCGAYRIIIKKLKDDIDDKKIPLMGVMGAFIFAAQMINFTIPATGSSGHIGGGCYLQ
jgi:cobalt/nickel transport system permease protein